MTHLLESKNILVVDDEIDIRELIQDYLELKGANVYVAGSGNEAIELVKKNKNIDLILSDIRMANGSGVELLDQVRVFNLIVPRVILMTGWADIEEKEAQARGAFKIIKKPFQMETLISTMIEAFSENLNESKIKRTYERIAIKLKVQFELSQKVKKQSQTLNIAKGGMFVISPDVLPNIGEEINFELALGERVASLLKGKGLVCWKSESINSPQPRGFGVEFLEIPRDQEEELVNFLVDYKKSRLREIS